MKISECYKTLGLPPDASQEEVKQAYRRLVNRWHPDRFARDDALVQLAEEHLKLFNLAYAEVKKHLATRFRRCRPCPGSAPRPGRTAAVSTGLRQRRSSKALSAPAVLNRLTRKFRQILSFWVAGSQRPARAGRCPGFSPVAASKPTRGTGGRPWTGPVKNFNEILNEVAGSDAARIKKFAVRKKRARRSKTVSRQNGLEGPKPAARKNRDNGTAAVPPVSRIKRVGRIRRI